MGRSPFSANRSVRSSKCQWWNYVYFNSVPKGDKFPARSMCREEFEHVISHDFLGSFLGRLRFVIERVLADGYDLTHTRVGEE